eukprot:1152020-Prymnesium_polylepis.1
MTRDGKRSSELALSRSLACGCDRGRQTAARPPLPSYRAARTSAHLRRSVGQRVERVEVCQHVGDIREHDGGGDQRHQPEPVEPVRGTRGGKVDHDTLAVGDHFVERLVP